MKKSIVGPYRFTYNQMIARYGDVKVKFRSYHKYSFFYQGVGPDDLFITAIYGGCPEDIYNEDVRWDTEITISELCPTKVIVKEGHTTVEYYQED